MSGARVAVGDFACAVERLPGLPWPEGWAWSVVRGPIPAVGQIGAVVTIPLGGAPLEREIEKSERFMAETGSEAAQHLPGGEEEAWEEGDESALATQDPACTTATLLVAYSATYQVPALYLQATSGGALPGASGDPRLTLAAAGHVGLPELAGHVSRQCMRFAGAGRLGEHAEAATATVEADPVNGDAWVCVHPCETGRWMAQVAGGASTALRALAAWLCTLVGACGVAVMRAADVAAVLDGAGA